MLGTRHIWLRLIPISTPHVKAADLLRRVVLVNHRVIAEFEPRRVLHPCCLRFQRWCNVPDAAPNTASSDHGSWRKCKMPFEPRDDLRHLLVEADYLIGRSAGLSFEEFLADETLRRAFVRGLEIIGEAAKTGTG